MLLITDARASPLPLVTKKYFSPDFPRWHDNHTRRHLNSSQVMGDYGQSQSARG